MIKHLLSKKRLLSLLFALFCGMQMGWAYGFSAVCPTGQTLYYTISNITHRYVRVTYPNNTDSQPWNGYTQPEGEMVIPSTVVNGSVTYTVTSIGQYAFSGCSGLTSVEIPNSVILIDFAAFSECSGLTSVEIPNSVTSIGTYAFFNCSGLTSVEISNSVTSIEMYTFRDCSGLNSVEIPNSVTVIGLGAFRGCSGLTSVVIPNSVTSIGNYAFSGCSGLTSITSYAFTPPVLGTSAFQGVNTDIPINVPCGASGAYQAATGWGSFSNIVEMCGSVMQTIALSTGDNWCSFYVETSLADVQNALIDALGTVQNEQIVQIQSQTENVRFTRGSWRGDLSSLDFAQTYMITVPSDCEITVEGVPVDPAEHPISLAPGANWIGYPVNATMTLDEAFGSSLPVNNDIIQSQEKNSIRTRGQWRGELGILQPSKGYMYQSASTGERTFTFPQ